MALPHTTVCICTFRRPLLLRRALEALTRQDTGGEFTFSIVVADNDADRSAETIVNDFAHRASTSVSYCTEPQRNIALARNAALARARGEFVAFIDDDEFPNPNWLLNLWRCCVPRSAAGVLGPVRPHFDCEPPRWLIKGGFFDRPEHETGFEMPWHECRTGNVLLRREILPADEPVFRPEFGTGGEDQDFFQRMIRRGHRFVWCNEAVVFETVPPARWSRRFLISRALLRGKNTLRQPTGRLRNLAKSALAVPAYALVLPVLLLSGHHHFMKYSVKLADHCGRLLALVGLNPISERPM